MKSQNDDQFDCWLRSLPKPTGVFAATDNRARHVTSNAEKLGIKVPQELIVLGVDNDPYQCELTRAPLSSIELKYKKMGQLAAKKVDERIGISDAKRFISLFSKEFGMTPLAHRKELERKHSWNQL